MAGDLLQDADSLRASLTETFAREMGPLIAQQARDLATLRFQRDRLHRNNQVLAHKLLRSTSAGKCDDDDKIRLVDVVGLDSLESDLQLAKHGTCDVFAV